jgi:hypothetical protein
MSDANRYPLYPRAAVVATNTVASSGWLSSPTIAPHLPCRMRADFHAYIWAGSGCNSCSYGRRTRSREKQLYHGLSRTSCNGIYGKRQNQRLLPGPSSSSRSRSSSGSSARARPSAATRMLSSRLSLARRVPDRASDNDRAPLPAALDKCRCVPGLRAVPRSSRRPPPAAVAVPCAAHNPVKAAMP